MRTLKLRTKILLGYAAPILITILVALVVFQAGATLAAGSAEEANSQAALAHTRAASLAFADMAAENRGYALTGNTSQLDAYNAAFATFRDSEQRLQELLPASTSRDLLDEMVQDVLAYDTLSKEVQGHVSAGRAEEARTLLAERGASIVASGRGRIAELETLQESRFDAAQARSTAALDQLNWTIIAGTLLGALLSLAAAAFIANRTARSINESVSSLSSIATEIAASVDEHERTAAQQAASVTETTTTLKELAGSAEQTNLQAAAAAESASRALRAADDGAATATGTLEAMTTLRGGIERVSQHILQLSEQTNQIGSVTTVIGDLSTQTNMLALNAAVEAARAGEHGRGFAIVAAEIRKLADQSKKSAERIGTLVGEINRATSSTVMVTEEGLKRAEEVARHTERSAEAFREVADAIAVASERSQQISFTAKQQTVAIGQVVDAMNSVDAGARETAAGITQTKVGLRQLEVTAASLKSMV